MTPPTVNAYYQPSQNNINFPAGILQPPFYDVTKDPAVNFGGIGVVIGHEMTHGFDDQGSQYDPKGNVRMWFTPEDLAKFKERSECYAKEYDAFEVAPGQNLNGHLTLGENSADNAGIRIAFQALQNTLREEGARRPSPVTSTASATDTRPSSASSSPSPRSGAARSPRRPPSTRPRPTRTPPASGASRAPCRTSTSSARPSAARRATP